MLLHRANQTPPVHSPSGSTFLHKMTSWPPSWMCNVKLRRKLTQEVGRTIPLNFIPIRFETTELSAFWRGHSNKNKMSGNMRSVSDLKKIVTSCACTIMLLLLLLLLLSHLKTAKCPLRCSCVTGRLTVTMVTSIVKHRDATWNGVF